MSVTRTREDLLRALVNIVIDDKTSDKGRADSIREIVEISGNQDLALAFLRICRDISKEKKLSDESYIKE